MAEELDSATQQPDQQATLGQSVAGPPPASLLSGLGGSGGMNPAMLMGLMQPPSQAATYAAALSGGVSAMRGQADPVQAILQNQQKNQMGVMEMLMKMQEHQDLVRYREQGRQDARNLHTQNLLEKYTGDLINSGDPEAKLLGWTTRGKQLAATGNPIPPDILSGLARGDLKDSIAQAVRMYGSVPFPEIMGMYRGIKPEHEAFIARAKTSDDYRKGLGLESSIEEKYKADEHEWKRKAAELAGIREERLYDAEQRQAASAEETARHNRATEERGLRTEDRAIRNEARADARLGLAEQHVGLAERRLTAMKAEWDRKYESKEEKKQAGFNVMTDWLDTLDTTANALEQKNYLPRSSAGPMGGLLSGNTQPAAAKLNRDLFYNDKDWSTWNQMLQGGGVGFERSVLNDIGPRAMAAFKGIMSFFDNPPTREAVAQASKFMRREIEIARGRTPGTPQEIVYTSGGKTFVEQWRKGDALPPDAQILTIDGEKPPQFTGR